MKINSDAAIKLKVVLALLERGVVSYLEAAWLNERSSHIRIPALPPHFFWTFSDCHEVWRGELWAYECLKLTPKIVRTVDLPFPRDHASDGIDIAVAIMSATKDP